MNPRPPQRWLALLAFVCSLGCEPVPTVPVPPVQCDKLAEYVDDTSPDAVTLPISVTNGLGSYFEARTLCVTVDGKRLGARMPAEQGAALRGRQPVELRAGLQPGISHRVRVLAVYVGTGAFSAYTFAVGSEREIAPSELSATPLEVAVVEVAPSTRTPLEQRPQVRWSGPGHTVIRH
ncbi:MAG: hypothetical protein JST00_42865 [Deltaproteobacteria bacterium]|nr:hypothetical protein [Deltaproteobacteria bacterium]